MRLADRLELAFLADWSGGAVYQRLGDLRPAGLVKDLSHASELLRLTRPSLPAAGGIAQVALNLGQSRETVLRKCPVSERLRQMLL